MARPGDAASALLCSALRSEDTGMWSDGMGRFGCDHGMIQPTDLVTVIVIGGALIALGLIPGLLAVVEDAMRNFSDLRFFQFPGRALHGTDYRHLPKPLWLNALGLTLILLSLVAYLAG
jgi:hypothetical protein